MSMRLFLTPRPPAAPVAGTFFSVTTHAALLAAVVGGHGTAAAPGDAPTRARVAGPALGGGGEQLHWVGVGEGDGTAARPPRPGARPPLAYVVPGRGSRRDRTLRRDGPRAGSPRTVARAEAAPAPAPRAPNVERPPVPPSPRPPTTLPDVALPDPDAAFLVAGVLSAAPDLARRASRPEDFVRLPPAGALGDAITDTEVTALEALRTMGHVDALPIPLVDNPPPTYPAALARAHVGGQVVVEFRIDSTGLIDLRSLSVVKSTNAAFTEAVRTVLPHLRFLPAQLGEHAVGVTVRQPFLFTVRPAR
jgi:protein TonB